MNIEEFRNYCIKKKGITEEFPFGPDTLVFKVMGRIFALVGLDEVPLRVNLKCDPERAIELREEHERFVFPGYHMNKKHWNTIILDGGLEPDLIFELTDHSYSLVVQGLNKKQQQELQNLE